MFLTDLSGKYKSFHTYDNNLGISMEILSYSSPKVPFSGGSWIFREACNVWTVFLKTATRTEAKRITGLAAWQKLCTLKFTKPQTLFPLFSKLLLCRKLKYSDQINKSIYNVTKLYGKVITSTLHVLEYKNKLLTLHVLS